MRHVIIGNGPAGVVAAETLRKTDPESAITLIGDEPEPPYSRMALPYLMMGEIDEAGTHLRKGKDHYAQLRIDLVRERVERVDTAARSVRLGGGASLAYDRLLIASGSHAIKPGISGIDLPGVYTCWTMDDARHIMRHAARDSRVLQIGAGFIGCIIMEALVSRGLRLAVVEMGDRMVPRMMTPVAGRMIRDWCDSKGVRVHLGAQVASIRAEGTELVATLRSGDEIRAETVIVSAGVRPNIDFLEGSGIACATGVIVDPSLRTSIPDVYAAGDVAEGLDFSTGKPGIMAIQPNAVDQARLAALNMAGRAATSRGSLAINVLDTLGLVSSSFGQWWGETGGASAELVDAGEYRYLSLQFSGDVLIGATCIGLTEHVGVLRGLIEGRVRLGPWRDRLLREPTRVAEAYLACAQAAA